MMMMHNGIETFCGYLNMPPPMQENAYNDLVKDTIRPFVPIKIRPSIMIIVTMKALTLWHLSTVHVSVEGMPHLMV